MQIPISPTIDLTNSIIAGICAFLLFRSYQKNKNQIVLLYFFQAYLTLFFAYLFFSLPRLLTPDDSLIIGIGFVIAQALLYLNIAFFVRVAVFFISSRWVKRIFWIVIILSLVAVVLNIALFNYPFYDKETGVTDWNIDDLVGVASAFMLIVVLLPSSILFFWQGIKSKSSTVRIRSVVISIGLLFLIITAYTYYAADTFSALLISDLFSVFSYLIIFFGVIYKRKISINN